MKTNGQISVWINGQFAQVWQNNNFHWATLSSKLLNKHGTIDYYDSLFHVRIRHHTKTQIFNLYMLDNSQLQINLPSCQQQANGVDCRIYAVANSFQISSGTGVSDIKIDKNRMRVHFFQYLQSDDFEAFS